MTSTEKKKKGKKAAPVTLAAEHDSEDDSLAGSDVMDDEFDAADLDEEAEAKENGMQQDGSRSIEEASSEEDAAVRPSPVFKCCGSLRWNMCTCNSGHRSGS